MVPADVPPHVRLVASTISQCRAVILLILLILSMPSILSHAVPDRPQCSEAGRRLEARVIRSEIAQRGWPRPTLRARGQAAWVSTRHRT